ncbi:acetate/propionate family kinase [Polycladidibacter stylochi]|uniref:acetate/propionate family kinase n=1 Tax=Polycladidibacter stylochi TaxID=1807766 RepID=UPI000B0696BB
MDSILVLNAGSSSIKFQLFQHETAVLTGLVDGIGSPRAHLKSKTDRGDVICDSPLSAEGKCDHDTALDGILDLLDAHSPTRAVDAIGHRVAHGYDLFSKPVLVCENIEAQLETLNWIAPLHNPHNLAGIRGAKRAFGDKPNVACFDTAFHRSQKFVNEAFALPLEYYEGGVRRFGFHGQSYHYIAEELKQVSPDLAEGRVVIAHLGNGASLCALKDGKSVATTMGFSPLDGLVMGTRCGLLDPGVVLYLIEKKGMTPKQVSDLLTKESGLKGLSGISQDMRDLEASKEQSALQALEYYDNRIRRELASLTATIGGLDALVFTGGVGENSARTRESVCSGLEYLGLEIDREANSGCNSTFACLSKPSAKATIFAIATNEEKMIARQTRELCLMQ